MRKEFSGIAGQTILTTPITSSQGCGTTFTVDSGANYPTGATAPFVVVIDRGLALEEKILCQSRSGNTFTISQRGYDGTVAQSHSVNAGVLHVIDADTVNEANQHANSDHNFVLKAGDTVTGELLLGSVATLIYNQLKASTVASPVVTSSTTYTGLTGDPSVTVTLGSNGRFMAIFGATMSNNIAGSDTYLSFARSGGGLAADNGDDARALVWTCPLDNGKLAASHIVVFSGFDPNSTVTITLRYRVSGGMATFSNRRLVVLPI